MHELTDLMQNEYEAMFGMDIPMPEDHKKAMGIIRSKFTPKEFLEVEEMLMGSYVEAEKFVFEQGFMRGIAVSKGGNV